jgi:predicted DNA-binding transcriptional regulator YafY
MRRADRLFQIVQLLRGGRLVTARMLADKLEVSERTIYRDIVDLQGSGVPVEGEAGVGYLMRDGYDLPPLMFTRDEIAALVAGARMVRAWGGLVDGAGRRRSTGEDRRRAARRPSVRRSRRRRSSRPASSLPKGSVRRLMSSTGPLTVPSG